MARVTRPRVDADPRVAEANEQHEAAAKAVRKALEPDPWPRLRIYARIFGTETVAKNRAAYLDARPHMNVENQARTASHARSEVEALRALTPAEAIERIEQTRAVHEAAREAAARALEERRRRLSAGTRDSGSHHDGLSLGG